MLCFVSGGIVFWADSVGPSHIYESLKKWANLYSNFFRPSRFLEERVAKGLPLVSISAFQSLIVCALCFDCFMWKSVANLSYCDHTEDGLMVFDITI